MGGIEYRCDNTCNKKTITVNRIENCVEKCDLNRFE